MIQPQSDEEVRTVEAGLRQLDDQLRIRWNPISTMSALPTWDAEGRTIPGKYEGRWEVGREEFGVFNTIWTVRNPDDDVSYMPVGEWLIAFFRKWDSQQADYRSHVEKANAEHDAAERRNAEWQDEEAAEEALHKTYHRLHGDYYIGRGLPK